VSLLLLAIQQEKIMGITGGLCSGVNYVISFITASTNQWVFTSNEAQGVFNVFNGNM
jgi:hypothetical protein